MTSVFARLCLKDFLRRRVGGIPPDATGHCDIPEPNETTPLVSQPEELVWYFVLAFPYTSNSRHMAPISRIQPFSRDGNSGH